MPKNPPITKLLTKASNLKQKDETWEATIQLGRIWITPHRNPAYRPHITLLASPTGAILTSQIQQTPPTPEQTLQHLLQAMCRPALGAGRPCRPTQIDLDNPDLVASLAPQLQTLDIDCQYRSPLAIAQKALKSLEKQMHRGRDLFPGLLSVPTITPPLVQHLYQLAADFHQAAPWRTLSDLHPIEIHNPPTAKPRYAVVMGSGGEIFGLAVYDSLKDLKRIYNQPLDPSQSTGPKSSCLMFYFDDAIAMAFDDLDDAAKYGWPITSEDAYPVFARSTPQDTLTTPSAADLFWLEGAIEGILTYYNHHQEIELGRVQPAELTLPINTLGAKTQLKLRLPAFSPFLD